MEIMYPLTIVLLSALFQAVYAALTKYSTKVKAKKANSHVYILVFAAGFLFAILSFLLWAYGLSMMKLAIAQPIYSGTVFLFTILFSVLLFKEKLASYKYIGFVVIIGGILILVL